MEVILVNCPGTDRQSWKQKRYPAGDCLGIACIAAVLREDGFRVTIIDGYLEHLYPSQIARRIAGAARNKRMILGFTLKSPGMLVHAISIVERLKRYGIKPVHTTLGGIFSTLAHRTILENFSEIFDSVVCGEGEDTVRELLKRLSTGGDWTLIPGVASLRGDSVKYEPRRIPVDLGRLPWPARDTLDRILEKGGEPHLLSSRGCQSNCFFCTDRGHFSHLPARYRWRCRPAIDMVNEIEWLIREKGVTRLMFNDHNMIGGSSKSDHLIEFAEEMQKRRLIVDFNLYLRAPDVEPGLLTLLTKVGLSRVFVGIESFWQPTLDRLNKETSAEENIRALRNIRQVKGLSLSFGMMMYHPWVTMEEIFHNLQMIRREIVGIPIALAELFSRLTQVLLIPKGTPIYHMAKREGLLDSESEYEGWLCGYTMPSQAARHINLVTGELSDLAILQAEMYDTFCRKNNCLRTGDRKNSVMKWILKADKFLMEASLSFARLVNGEEGEDTIRKTSQGKAVIIEKAVLLKKELLLRPSSEFRS